MNTANTQIPQDLPDQLKTVLQKQVQLVKNNKLTDAQTLAERAGAIVAQIIDAPSQQQSLSREKCEEVLELYKKLTLMLEAEKNNINRQQRKVSNGKKTLRAYHRKIL